MMDYKDRLQNSLLEPGDASDDGGYPLQLGDYEIAEIHGDAEAESTEVYDDSAQATVERFLAVWNFCAGVPTSELKWRGLLELKKEISELEERVLDAKRDICRIRRSGYYIIGTQKL